MGGKVFVNIPLPHTLLKGVKIKGCGESHIMLGERVIWGKGVKVPILYIEACSNKIVSVSSLTQAVAGTSNFIFRKP